MTTVIKRGGRKQDFDASKIRKSVRCAARDAGIPLFHRCGLVMQVANPVIRACRKRKTISSSAIKKMVLSRLQRKSKDAAAAWRKYESRHRRKR
ncbi:MAG: ATP cone domain-containing protein [Candidatus Nanoarchaeia archaeon]|nr:ATP cone domain-containing protein [Candidatus Nanoarchaeia archaeon]